MVNLPTRSDSVRKRLIAFAREADAPLHLVSSLSAVDILVAVSSSMNVRTGDDVFILSKGHAALGMYAMLAETGDLTEDQFATYGHEGGNLPVHPERGCRWWNQFSTGSLGHGVGLGVGVLLARRFGVQVRRCVVLVGDGECQEGSVWEAAVTAVALDVRGLCVVVDVNGYGQTRRASGPGDANGLSHQFAALGWSASHVDGHDADAVADRLNVVTSQSTPTVVLAQTVKGYGSPAMIAALPGSHYATLREQ